MIQSNGREYGCQPRCRALIQETNFEGFRLLDAKFGNHSASLIDDMADNPIASDPRSQGCIREDNAVEQGVDLERTLFRGDDRRVSGETLGRQRSMKALRISRTGVTLVEVLVVGAIAGVILMMLLMGILRSRESARLATCNNNLAQIGRALIQYDGASGQMPIATADGPGPLAVLAEQFGFAYFGGKSNAKPMPMGAPATARKVAGFLCIADTNVSQSNGFSAPTSYRGNAGSGTNGQGGAFAFGHAVAIANVETDAGKDFTAGFSERLLGSGQGGKLPQNDYLVVKGPIGAEACPVGPAESWKGDAGSSWMTANWTSTLYNHAMPPNASPSCVADDGKSARMGASSAHQNRVNVLMLGGGVRGFTTSVDREIWRKFGGALSRPPTATDTGP